MDLHKTIKEKLAYFIEQNKIPHILFHGPAGSGKRTLVYKFVSDIYENDKQLIKNYTMFADCAHGKGIKFIREELKFFAKTNVNIQGSGHFKTIVLTNADKLTTDAQSALRRCIELFSHNTRFFIIVENKYNLLKPILSRLCEIYIDTPNIEGGLYGNNNNITNKGGESGGLPQNKGETTQQKGGCGGLPQNKGGGCGGLHQELTKLSTITVTNAIIVKLVNKLYEKGYSGLDLMHFLEQNIKAEDEADNTLQTYKLLMLFHKIKSEFRNEQLFMTFILTFMFVPNATTNI
uniref:AAA+ ATPase domain-containing protein n=1 Tax=viral metagenome TaxID=1070528 RepID=A0A6C0IHX1_9ZZZZ